MKRFRIVKEQVLAYEGRPVEIVPLYRIEQRHHLLWIFAWWSTPSFALNKWFSQSEVAEQFVWQKYPNALII